jgi:hypothetical protein
MPSLFSEPFFECEVLVRKTNLMVQNDIENAPSSAEKKD